MDCVHCGLPMNSDCVNHINKIERRKTVVKKARATLDQSIHPRVVGGKTVHAKVNTKK